MRVHSLKTHPGPFSAVRDGSKPFEWRNDDRAYEVGDVLVLREYDPGKIKGAGCYVPDSFGYTGRVEVREVTYVLRGRYGVPDGFAVLALRPVESGVEAAALKASGAR